ncbi:MULTISPECIES: DNA primase [unclassified Aureispira]|uniref:DNA primase n=1 Tax=unclassified Aureispira TaxID=2649989 RepID=UPI0006963DA5|nr:MULTISPECIES: DNA primase [unclassified Aureispira]WMX14367.1 DNA primase [Aureispira sp. CCB-E]
MITQKTIQTIFETVKVEDVVGDFVKLTRRGVNYIGLCPFHNEKTPSFTVSPAKNIYKCFGCGEGGNAVNFIMDLEQLSYPEALKSLAKKYNIPIEEDELTEEQAAQLQLSDSLYVVNQFAKEHFQQQLFETDYGKSVGLSYFKQRGFREEIIKKFGLGFANGGANDLMQKGLSKGYEEEVLEKAGLIKNKRDFFKNRVQFPIHNVSGKVIGFGGRILTANKKAPKYLNTPETDIYNKRKTLYGIYFARKAIVKMNECYMVEGYTDVISLHQAGIENIVASSGTSLTADQVRLVKRYAPNMTILYDGDKAGIKAALRGLDIVIEQDMNVKVVLLPEGEDPDSYLKKVGATAFKEFIDREANDFILFKSNLLLKDAEHDPIKKSEVIKDIVGSIAKIPDALKRSVYVKECAQLMEMSEQLLHTEINKRIQANAKKQYQQEQRQKSRETKSTKPSSEPDYYDPYEGMPSEEEMLYAGGEFPMETGGQPQKRNTNVKKKTAEEYQEMDIARILINFGDRQLDKETTVAEFILLDMLDMIEEFDHPICSKIVQEYLTKLQANEKITTNYFTYHSDPAVAKLAVDLVARMEEHDFSEGWERLNVFLNTQELPEINHVADAKSSILRFKLKKIERLIRKNQLLLKASQEAKNDTDVLIYMKVSLKLMEIKKDLATQMNTVVLR